MYRINQNQEIIGLLVKIKEVEQEYPADLFAARRTSFLILIARYIYGLVRI
jgi:hypothetical protein